ncbi:MAG: amino acid adenylation domain-containing protein [Chloroflexi bacterium]|nr:amino acid adenylation domain-containing protein [Chloroflexota bacterium]
MNRVEESLQRLTLQGIQVWSQAGKLRYAGPQQRITPAVLDQLKTDKAALLAWLSEPTYAPLSAGQRGLWFIQQQAPENSAYTVSLAYRIQAALDVELLCDSIQLLVNRHAVLRTRFIWQDDALVQQIDGYQAAALERLEVGPCTEAALRQQLRALHEQPFDLSTGPLFRTTILNHTEQSYTLLLSVHHIVVDGWSIYQLVDELFTFYAALRRGVAVELPIMAHTYHDYVTWQQTLLETDGARLYAYWQAQLSGELPVLQLPTDFPRPPQQTLHGIGQPFQLSPTLTEQLKQVARQHHCTLYVVLLAAYQLLLHRYSGQEDLLVGLPMAGRSRPEFAEIVGYFTSPVVVRTNLAGDPTFAHLLAQVKGQVLAALDHQDYPFVRLVEQLNPQRDPSRSPIFQASFLLQKPHRAQELLVQSNKQTQFGFAIELIPLPLFEGQEDIALELIEAEHSLFGHLKGNVALFAPATLARMVGHFQVLLEGIVANPDQPSSDLPLLTAAERRQLLVEWNNTAVAPDPTGDYPKDQCIHDLFEAQVARTPETVAVVFEDQQLTYRELNARANQLAHHLQSLGVGGTLGAETLVGICVERSIEMVVGLLGILKAGGAYVPLDPSYPAERLAFMLEDANVAILLTTSQLLEQLPTSTAHLLCLDRDWPQIAQASRATPISQATLDHLAYVIYTSGSTGQPKGVEALHRGLVNRCQWMWRQLPFLPGEVACQKTALAFVDSVWEIFGPLVRGVRLVVLADAVVKDPQAFITQLAIHQVSRLVVVPSLLQVILESDLDLPGRLPLLTYWICSGEALTTQLAQLFQRRLPQARLFNLYGSSEVAGDVTWFEVTADNQWQHSATGVPIGRPIDNTQVYVLDAHRQPMPPGVPGQLYVGGDNVARGYHKQTQLTAERFVANPYGAGKLYRTGDLARWRPDPVGSPNLEYLGRSDQQVKIRGFRIELGEIEAVLTQHPAVKEAVVIAQALPTQQKQLTAYVVLQNQQARQPLQFSLFYFAAAAGGKASGDSYTLYCEGAKFADQHDFTAIWTPERHFHAVGGQYPNPAVLSAALAMITHKIQLRSGSVVLPIQNPLRVAEEWAVVDNLSHGRVGVSFASGWHPIDFAFYPENFAQRKELLLEQIQQVQALWRGEAITVHNGLGKETQVKVFPRPIQKTLPFWLTAAGNPATFEQAGKLGANLLTHLLGQSLNEVAEKITLYRNARAEAGHDPATGHVTMMIHTFIWGDKDEAIERARAPFCEYLRAHIDLIQAMNLQSDLNSASDLEILVQAAFERYVQTASLIGTAKSCLNTVQRLQAMGVNEVACLVDFGIDEDIVLEGLGHLEQLRQLSQTQPVIDTRELYKFLQQKLPTYMLPAHYQILSELPRTPNGKLDRAPLRTAIKDYKQLTEYAFVPPTTTTEKSIAAIWSAVLGSEQVGIHHNFFAIGGHSLLVMQVISRIRATFSIDISLRDFFERPTVFDLAKDIETHLLMKTVKVATFSEDKEVEEI